MEKAVIVGLKTSGNRLNFESSLLELKNLSQTAGASIIDTVIQERKAPDPATFIGKGKAEEVANIAKSEDADLIIFDHELSPTQQRNLEKITDTKVIDRTALILDIFSEHAHSKAGKLQVQLAQYNYLLPRLTRMWTHLSRIGGAIGTRGPGRGPGEKQLEVDRRRILAKISRLKKQLVKVEKTRRTQRKNREKSGVLRVVLVGYTNSGKSSLINALTKASVIVEDKLFSTLDPTSRKISSDSKSAVVTDTVGFIDNLPHQLIEAFKSTLEEVTEADLLLKVTDASADDFEERLKVVDSVLNQIGAHNPSLLVINKIDLVSENELKGLMNQYPDAVFTSTVDNKGIDRLREQLLK